MSAEVRRLLELPMRNYTEWERFDAELNQLFERRLLQTTTPLRRIHGRDEEWYRDPSDGEIYVYLKPDDRILPVWERVDVFAPPPVTESRDLRVGGLKLITTGQIRKETAWFLKTVLASMAQEGQIEILLKPELPLETWCREYSTDNVYKLVAAHHNEDYRWEYVSTGVPTSEPPPPN
jgi:hypothetical protein